MPHIQLVVVQPTPFCNINCRYCYLPDRTNNAVLADETIANLFSQVFASGWLQHGLTVVWHAGEPMVLPIDFYRRAFRLIDSLKPAETELTHAFQTNGTLIDDAGCAFFTEADVNVEESEGGHVSRSFGETGIEDSYCNFLRDFWRMAAAAPGKFGFIREIDDATRLVLRPKEAVFFNQLVEPFAITSMDWAGNIATFSPELLGLKSAEYGDFILGNINRDKLTDMAAGTLLQRMRRDIDAGVDLCRERCDYFSICGGGEPVNKLSENGSFVSTETTYCRMSKMRATDLVLDLIELMGNRGGELADTDIRNLGAPPLATDVVAAVPVN